MEQEQQEVLQIIESAKAESPASHLTKKYSFFSTKEIISELAKSGWSLAKQGEVKIRKTSKNYNSRIGKQKHLLIFENPNFIIENEGKINICIRNAHDGGGCLEIFYGFMRIVCSNQIFSKSLGDGKLIKLRHSQNHMIEFQETIKNVSLMVDRYKRQIMSLKSKTLNVSEIHSLAEQAILARFGEISKVAQELDVRSLFNTKRIEDEGNNAWVVFNRIQEHLIKGGVTYDSTNKKGLSIERKTRALKGINSQVEFNDTLYQKTLALV